MKKLYTFTAFLLRSIILGLAMALLVIIAYPQAGASLRHHLGLATPSLSTSVTAPLSYAQAVHRAAPSVVSIYANRLVLARPIYPDPMLKQMFGLSLLGPPQQRQEQSLGSGVIVSPKGYILTNNHVIAGTNNIRVILYDGRVAPAKIVGTDPKTDLAVLRIHEPHLPAAASAATKPLQVGDIVLAIGNPFGIGQTVTMGIVSALGRQLNLSSNEDFIQTDAAINSGNSGGALVNTLGQLVGINTAMLGHNIGAEGIGFAIPVRTAEWVMHQLIRYGPVSQGWMGAHFGKTSSSRHDSPSNPGILVTSIRPDSPAAHAGLQRGDILLRINKQPIRNTMALHRYEASGQAGRRVQLSGLRNGKSFKIELLLSDHSAASILPGPGRAQSAPLRSECVKAVCRSA